MSGSTEQEKKTAELEKKAYDDFLEKVKRTVFLDNLSPQVTSAVVKTALGQFGTVNSVEFIPNYTVPYDIPQMALAEMETEKQALGVVNEITNYPFMMSGAPRPVRAQLAKAEMFVERPRVPGRKVQVQWLGPSDNGFEVARKLKDLYRKHQKEHLSLIKLQLDEEKKLAMQQDETLKANFKKYDMIDGLMHEGIARRLANHYGFSLNDDR